MELQTACLVGEVAESKHIPGFECTLRVLRAGVQTQLDGESRRFGPLGLLRFNPSCLRY